MRALILALIALCGCANHEKVITVAATSVPHAEMLEQVKPELESQGIKLKIETIDDYNLPNRLLSEGSVDANFFQHEPFLKEQMANFGYKLEVLARVHIEPLGLYSRKIDSLRLLPPKATIAIPSDPTNEERALLFLQQLKLITLKEGKGAKTIHSIDQNIEGYKIEEIDPPLLPRILPDVTVAVIPLNFALSAHLSPKRALALESLDSPYVNVLVIRAGDDRSELKALSNALKSPKMRDFVTERYKGYLLMYNN